jgi:hypothetical protein
MEVPSSHPVNRFFRNQSIGTVVIAVDWIKVREDGAEMLILM